MEETETVLIARVDRTVAGPGRTPENEPTMVRLINLRRPNRYPLDRRRRVARPQLEAMEERQLLSQVINAHNAGAGSLRAAILDANANPGSTITFDLPDGVTEIKPTSPLPKLTGAGTIIDGSLPDDPDDPFDSLGSVQINGSQAGDCDGLYVTGDDCQLGGLTIVNFARAGIHLTGQYQLVKGCQIGRDLKDKPAGNGTGIFVDASYHATIDNCIVSSNDGDGIRVEDSLETRIKASLGPGFGHVEGNNGDGIVVIGIMPTLPLGGIEILNTQVTGQVIDANRGNGVHLIGSGFNRIGLPQVNGFNWIGGTYHDDPAAFQKGGNLEDGVRIDSTAQVTSAHNLVAFNYVAGNRRNGVTLSGPNTWGNILAKNRIGLTVELIPEADPILHVLGNKKNGVEVAGGANNNDVGGDGLYDPADSNENQATGVGNIIVASGVNGVRLAGSGTTLNRVIGNIIGADGKGMTAIANKGDGVLIEQGASQNFIGGPGQVAPETGDGNVISGNGGSGVHIRGEGTKTNKVLGNLIGTKVTGNSALGNFYGVLVESGATDNRIGAVAGDSGPLGNVISGNTNAGVALSGLGTSGNLVQANKIGTNLKGDGKVGNGLEGVLITLGASGNLVGGPSAGPADPQSAGNLISGNRMDGVGILLAGTTKNAIQGNLIGTKASGLEPLPNGQNGVLITADADGNLVGGDAPNLGNLISGNTQDGIVVDADVNYVMNNWVGIKTTGQDPLSNGGDGIDLLGSGNGVGWNVVSGNLGHGVAVHGSRNVIVANKIGTNVDGSGPVGNHQDGVYFQVSSGPGGNWLGAPLAGAGNLISGNGWNGVEATGHPTFDNLIRNNRIGTDATGFESVGNSRNGIFINNTPGFTIGGKNSLEGNQVSGNSLDGILITGRLSTGISVLGNLVGTNANATAAVYNVGNGVHIDGRAGSITVGGLTRSEGNVISGNVLDGILIGLSQGEGNKVLGNKIGTDFDGKYSIANFQHGVEIVGSSKNTIGGDADGSGNLISGNTHDGVRLVHASSTLISGNKIGTDFDGTQKIANGGNGVMLLGASANNMIGGIPTTNARPGNVISGNGGSGVVLVDAGTTNNQIVGNFIGTNRTGDRPLGNQANGITILAGATANVIGGLGGVGLSLPGNIISGNSGDGVRIWGIGASNNAVFGNRIGTYATDQPWMGNVGHGVFIAAGASNNSVGGSSPQMGNVVANNGKAGVAVGNTKMDFDTLHNTILSNSIYGNLGLGIDLGDDDVSPNKPGGPNSGPNQFQNAPEIAVATVQNGITTIRLSLVSAPMSPFVIQVFVSPTSDPSGHGEGKTLLLGKIVMTNIQKTTGPITVTVPQNLLGQYISATATAFSGDTSEFSNSMPVTAAASARPGAGSAAPGERSPGSPAAFEFAAPPLDAKSGNRVVIGGPVVAGPLAELSVAQPSPRVLQSAQGTRTRSTGGITALKVEV